MYTFVHSRTFYHFTCILIDFNEKLGHRARVNPIEKITDQRYLKWLLNSGLASMNRVELGADASRIVRAGGGELNMPDVLTSQPLVGYEEMCEDSNLDAYDPTGTVNYKYFAPNNPKPRVTVLLAKSTDEGVFEKRIQDFKDFLERLYNINDLHFVIPPESAKTFQVAMPDALMYFLFESFNNFGFSLDLFRSSSATWFGAGLLSKDLQRVHLYRHDARHPQRVLDYLAALDKPFPVDVTQSYKGTIPPLGLPNRFFNYKYFNNLRDWNLFRFEYLTLNETLNLPFRDVWSSRFKPPPYDCERKQAVDDELDENQERMGPVTEYIRKQPNYPSMSIGQSVMNAKLGIYPWAFTEAARLELPLRFARDADYVDKKLGKAKNHFARFGTSFALVDPDADSYANAITACFVA